ncbi:putative ribonuclease H-like domain-containing protein [Tanacetum coccineum]
MKTNMESIAQRVNKPKSVCVPLALVQTRTGTNPVNAAKASSTNNFSTARHSVNRQTVLTSTALKVNTVKPMMSDVRSANVFHKTNSPSSRPFKRTTVIKPNLFKQRFILLSRHMDRKLAYLADFQEFNGGALLPFGGSKGYIIRFSWTFFLRTKDETSAILKDFIRQIENQLNQKVKTIRCDNGTEFKNKDVIEFCGLKGIKREYSNARTPQQNGVAERKNRTLIEAARTMLADSFLPNTFWAEAVSTACYVLNRVLVTKPHNKTPYELLTVPFWHSYSSTNTSSSKSDKKRGSPREEEQVFLDDLARLQRQEKEANEEAKALTKNLEQENENLVTQAEAAKTSGTNIISTVSTTAKASGTNFVNTVSIPVGTASANEDIYF